MTQLWESFLWDTSGQECAWWWFSYSMSLGAGHVSLPYSWNIQGYHKPTIPRRRHLHPNIWDSIPVYSLHITAGDSSAKKLCKSMQKDMFCFKLRHNRNIATHFVVKPPNFRGKNASSVPVCVPVVLSIKLGVSLNQNEWAFNDRGCFLQRPVRVYLSS